PPCVGAGGGGDIPRGGRPQGRGLARRGSRLRCSRLSTRSAVALDSRHGRCPQRRDGRLPCEGNGATAGGCRCVRRAAARFARSCAALRPSRERRDRSTAARPRARLDPMQRSETTIALGAIRHNVRRLVEALDGAQLWGVVKANGYGHGATDVGSAALEAGASALCVVTVAEALELRRELPEARIIVMCPTDELSQAREARLELVISGSGETPEDVPVHFKLDTRMGRW